MRSYNDRLPSISAPRRNIGPKNPARHLVGSFGFRVFLLFITHMILAVLVRSSSIFSTLHAFLTLGLAFFFLLTDREPFRLMYMLGYITGAELLWRGTHAQIFWETGKYAITFLALFAMLRYWDLSKVDKRPVFYFAFLLPSIFVMPSFDRSEIAFNLSGPLALAVGTMFFSAAVLTREHLKNMLLMMLAPIISLGILVALGIVTADILTFAQGSLFSTSAEIGPNQVSSVLGLGALAAFLYVILENQYKFLRFLGILLTIWLLAQTALTFARGGFWTTLGAIAMATLYLIRDRRTRGAFFAATILIALIVNYVVYPALDRFTSGALVARFSDFGTTGRFEIVKSDLVVFTRNPLFGVGPHQSKPYHAIFFRYSSAHTEYSRMLSEHGSFGALSLIIMGVMVLSRLASKSTTIGRAFMIAFLVWALLFMSHSAMRLAAPSFLFALAFAKLELFDRADDRDAGRA